MAAPLVIRPAARSDVEVLTDLAMRSKASHTKARKARIAFDRNGPGAMHGDQ